MFLKNWAVVFEVPPGIPGHSVFRKSSPDGHGHVLSSSVVLDTLAGCVMGLGRQFHRGTHVCEIA